MAALALQSTFRACGPSTCIFWLATDTVIKSFDHGNLKGMEKTLGAIKLQEYALRDNHTYVCDNGRGTGARQ